MKVQNVAFLNSSNALNKANSNKNNNSIGLMSNSETQHNYISNAYYPIAFKANPERTLSRALKPLLEKAGEIKPEMIDKKIARLLLKVAETASEKSYAPYSNFHVGAAVISRDGKIYKGCNVENASYGLTLCAERNTLSTMVAADGHKQIAGLACMAKEAKGGEVWPCGACRQWIEEFDTAETAKIIADNHGTSIITTTQELLPRAFGPKDLEGVK